jgi:hypothetical protein
LFSTQFARSNAAALIPVPPTSTASAVTDLSASGFTGECGRESRLGIGRSYIKLDLHASLWHVLVATW